MASKSMCDSEHVDPSDPLTWEPDCIFGNCSKCPVLSITIPDNAKNKEVNFFLWTYQMSQEKGKNIFGLFRQNMSVADLVTNWRLSAKSWGCVFWSTYNVHQWLIVQINWLLLYTRFALNIWMKALTFRKVQLYLSVKTESMTINK